MLELPLGMTGSWGAGAQLGVEGGLLLLLLWLLAQLLLVGGLEGHLPAGGPTLVGEGVIGGSSPSSRGLIGGVRMTVSRKTVALSFKSSSSTSSVLPKDDRMGDALLGVGKSLLRLASGGPKLRLLLALERDPGKEREEGGAIEFMALSLEVGGDLRQVGVFSPLSGSDLIGNPLLKQPFLFSGDVAVKLFLEWVPLDGNSSADLLGVS